MADYNSSSNLILVTGGAGYIGTTLVPVLLDSGYRVRVLDNFLYGDAGLRQVRNRIELVAGDIRSVGPEIFEDVTGIINLGGLSAEPAAEYRPEVNREINASAAANLARQAKAAGVKRFIQASSCSIYDVGAGNPEKDICHAEDFPVNPFRIYSITKRDAEKEILALADAGFIPVFLRKGSVFGYSPRMRMDLVVNTFTYHAMTVGRLVLHNGGEMWRPLLDVRDAAAAYKTVLEAPAQKVSGQIFNVLCGNYRISELALRVRHAVGKLGVRCELDPDYEFRNLRSCQASPQKIKALLGFTPQFSVEDGVEDLVAKIRSGVLSNLDHPIYHNIKWVDYLEESKSKLGFSTSVFSLSPAELLNLCHYGMGAAAR